MKDNEEDIGMYLFFVILFVLVYLAYYVAIEKSHSKYR